MKIFAGVVSGSAAMLAEAAHSVADTTNQGFLITSIQRGQRGPDEEHPFGHGKERFFWSFLAAVLIFLAGAIFSIGQACSSSCGRRTSRASRSCTARSRSPS